MNEPSVSIQTSLEVDGTLLRIVLSRPKGNVIDRAMVQAIRRVVAEHRETPGLRSILFEGEGRHFSFGASVEDHLPGAIEEMLPAFHDMFRELAASRKVLMAALRGQCLGGGLELAAFCQRVVASPDTKLGQPEIRLGVFAPAASAFLPHRIGQAAADDLLLTGRVVDAEEALRMGLVDALEADPAAALIAWHSQYLLPLSASTLAFAVGAARDGLYQTLLPTLDRLEQRYLRELMATGDAVEGIAAFLEKRTPQWKHR